MHLLLTSYKGVLLCDVQKRMDQRLSIPISETTISHAVYKSGHIFTKTFSNLNKIKFAPGKPEVAAVVFSFRQGYVPR